MKLYTVHDNKPGMGLYWEETTTEAVWADDAETAARLYLEVYPGDPLTPDDLVIEEQAIDPARDTPSRAHPHRERRPEFLRSMGWREECESACVCCSLAPMGLAKYALCPSCECCPECGCECADDAVIVYGPDDPRPGVPA